ncbi:MAG: helix-turn-helix transcriptional regulator [Pseudomonadota bacterium]
MEENPNLSDGARAFSENVRTLIARYELTGPALARAAKIDQKTVWRIYNGQTEPGLDVVTKIARVYKFEPWQLLVPGFDPALPPTLATLVPAERELLDRLRTLIDSASGASATAPGLAAVPAKS